MPQLVFGFNESITCEVSSIVIVLNLKLQLGLRVKYVLKLSTESLFMIESPIFIKKSLKAFAIVL